MDWLLLIPAFALLLWVVALARLLIALLEAGRAYQFLPAGPPPLLFRCLWWPLIALASVLAPLLRAPWRVRLVRRLQRAGVSGSLEPGVWAALQVLLAATAALLLTVDVTALATPGALAALGVIPLCALLPEFWLRARIRARERELQAAWPTHLDLLSLGLDAGCSLTLMVSLLAVHSRCAPLCSYWQQLQSDLRSGRSREEALLRMERRAANAAISSTLAAINQAAQPTAIGSGARLAAALRAQVRERSAARAAQLERMTQARPLAALLPAAVCAAPGLLALVLLPLALWLAPALLH